MATIKISYNGTSYPLYLTSSKVTTPSLIISGQGYAPLYSGKNFGDPVLYGSSILKCAPMKITNSSGTVYRPTWFHENIGTASCIVYYKAAFTQNTKSQNDKYWVTTDQYGNGYWKDNWVTYYQRTTTSQIYIGSFAITSSHSDLSIVINSLTVSGVNVNNTWGNISSQSTSWSKTAPAYPTFTQSGTASGTYQIKIGSTVIKSGNCSVSFSVSISTSTQQNTAHLTLSI